MQLRRLTIQFFIGTEFEPRLHTPVEPDESVAASRMFEGVLASHVTEYVTVASDNWASREFTMKVTPRDLNLENKYWRVR